MSRPHRTVGALVAAAALIATQLIAAPPAQADNDDDPLCYTTRSDGHSFYDGLSASKVYDDQFFPGVSIPQGLLDGHYDPQGLASWPNWNGSGEDVLLISAYEDTNGNADPDGPSAIFGVVASGSRLGTGLGRMLIDEGHVAGLAVYGGWLYVGSEENIRGYKLSTLKTELDGANTNTVRHAPYNRASSYTVGFLGSGDGHLWAGDFDENNATHLNGYVQSSSTTGALTYQSATQAYAPKKTQGVTVTPSYVIFSTSYDRNERGNIWVMPRNQRTLTDANSYCFRAPSMNEGITQLNNRVFLGFESGSYTYNHGDNTSANPITKVHYASTAGVTGLYASGPAD